MHFLILILYLGFYLIDNSKEEIVKQMFFWIAQ